MATASGKLGAYHHRFLARSLSRLAISISIPTTVVERKSSADWGKRTMAVNNSACAECGASNDTGAVLCGGCGMPLRVAPPPVRKNPPTAVSGGASRTQASNQASRLERAADTLGEAGKHTFLAGCSLFFVVPLLLVAIFLIAFLFS